MVTLVQTSIQMETVAMKAREGWDLEGQQWGIRWDHQEQRCVITDQS